MSDKLNDLPRDLRSLCGGYEEDPDCAYRILLDPVMAYANVVAVRRDLEREIADPETHVESIVSLRKELEFVKREESGLKQRITNHFKPRASMPGTSAAHPFPQVDQGVKSKVMKLMADVDAGTYHLQRETKTLQAVRQALAFSRKNGRMPYPSELIDLGYTIQQVTDAGKWLAMQADYKCGPPAEPTRDSLIQPLKDGRGRGKKK